MHDISTPKEIMRHCLRLLNINVKQTGDIVFHDNCTLYMNSVLSQNHKPLQDGNFINGIEKLEIAPPGFWKVLTELYYMKNTESMQLYSDLVFSLIQLIKRGKIKPNNLLVVYHDAVDYERYSSRATEINFRLKGHTPKFIDLTKEFLADETDLTTSNKNPIYTCEVKIVVTMKGN